MSNSIAREVLAEVLDAYRTERIRYYTDPQFRVAVELAVQTLEAVELTLADFHMEDMRRPVLVRTLGRLMEQVAKARELERVQRMANVRDLLRMMTPNA